MKKYNWFDIEKMLGDGTLKEQPLDVLNELALVEPEPSSNPRYHARFAEAKKTIHFLISQKKPAERKFHETPVGIVVLSVISTVIAAFIVWKLGWL